MNDKEKQKVIDHYSALPDGTILELLDGGEAGLIEGAS